MEGLDRFVGCQIVQKGGNHCQMGGVGFVNGSESQSGKGAVVVTKGSQRREAIGCMT